MKEKKYYGDKEFSYIMKLLKDKKFNEATYKLEEYLEKYPYDTCACTSYANLLIKNGELEKAADIIEKTVITSKTSEITKTEIVKVKIKLLCCEGKYRECYEYFLENNIILMNDYEDYYNVLAFLAKKLGIEVEIPEKMKSYTVKQIQSYDEIEAINHIKKHADDYSSKDYSCFNTDFPLEEMYTKIRNVISTNIEYNLHSGAMRDVYIFKYDANGRSHQKMVDYIKVIAIQGTNDIITMYPYDNKANLPYIDLTPQKEIEEMPKIKRLSQIDKFNQRYGKNS